MVKNLKNPKRLF